MRANTGAAVSLSAAGPAVVSNNAKCKWRADSPGLLNLNPSQLQADLTAKERDSLLTDFHESRDKIPILICSYFVGYTSINMHGHCRTIIEVEPPPSEGVRRQVLGRVQRTGQTKWIRHISLLVQDSFNTAQVVTSLLSLPALMIQLNLEVWGGVKRTRSPDL